MTHHATTVAVDLSMTVFEIGIADRRWRVVERRRLNRRQFARLLADQPASRIVMEACGTAHHWGRVAQGHGHRVTLLPVRYVKPYLRGNKTDRTDVDAFLDAVRTGHISPVTVKTAAQQEIVAWHRIREQWMATRTARINALRGFFREHGLPLAAGPRAALAAVPTLAEQLPAHLALAVTSVYDDVRSLDARHWTRPITRVVFKTAVQRLAPGRRRSRYEIGARKWQRPRDRLVQHHPQG